MQMRRAEDVLNRSDTRQLPALAAPVDRSRANSLAVALTNDGGVIPASKTGDWCRFVGGEDCSQYD